MLFKRDIMPRIADGSVSLAFRRWKRPAARAGGRQRTSVGELAIDSVDLVGRRDITVAEAMTAGYSSKAELLRELSRFGDGDIYRIAFHLKGADPRIALREQDDLGEDELAGLVARLDRCDRSSRNGAWTSKTLDLIASNPGRRAGDLASELGLETQHFKRNVRKLKELGLTESLEVGYRLSPRGRAVLRSIENR